MFDVFWRESFVSVMMFLFLLVGVLTRMIIGFWLETLIREADHMNSTKNRLLRQCKLQFANCYQQRGNGLNITVFVDKFVQRLSAGPVSFDCLYHLSAQFVLLSVVCAGIGVSRSIAKGRTWNDILPFYIVCFIGLYLFFSVSGAMDVKRKKYVLKIVLVDFLENQYLGRVRMTVKNGGYEGSDLKKVVDLIPISEFEKSIYENV